MSAPTTAAPEPKTPFWRNPFFLGFLIGAAVLTVLPFLQRPFLKAPPPVRAIAPWSTPSLGGADTSSAALEGSVVLLTVESGPCDEACVQRQKDFGTARGHLDDLKGRAVLVTLAGDDAKAALTPFITAASPAWRFGGAPPAELAADLQAGLDQFRGQGGVDVLRANPIILLDQQGALRGFWPNDGAGRGNSINAARLLAKHGPNP